MQKSAYNNGKTSSAEAVEALKTCYKNAVAVKTWGNLDVTKKDITLLTTKTAAQAKEITLLKTSSGGTEKSWLLTFAGTTKKDSNGDAYDWCKLCGPGGISSRDVHEVTP